MLLMLPNAIMTQVRTPTLSNFQFRDLIFFGNHSVPLPLRLLRLKFLIHPAALYPNINDQAGADNEAQACQKDVDGDGVVFKNFVIHCVDQRLSEIY